MLLSVDERCSEVGDGGRACRVEDPEPVPATRLHAATPYDFTIADSPSRPISRSRVFTNFGCIHGFYLLDCIPQGHLIFTGARCSIATIIRT